MKLYTEEQVRFIVNESRDCVDWWEQKFDLTQEEVISQVTPIELPSDEEIEKYFKWGYGGDGGSAIYGAKWMKEQILNQKK